MSGRLLIGYLAVFALSAGLATWAFLAGEGKHSEPKVAGIYEATGPCAGKFSLDQSGQFVDASGGLSGSLRFRNNRLTGTVSCHGTQAQLDAERVSDAELKGTVGGAAFDATYVSDLPKPGAAVTTSTAKPPSNEVIFGRLMLAIAAVILAARLVRALIGRIGQPPVMGEVLAGILLGPTLLGSVAPSVSSYLFPSFVLPLLTAGADIGLVFYMFIVGLELDTRMLKGRLGHAAAISNAAVVLPLGLGIALALPLYKLLGTPGKSFPAFALFMGVAMSITAFPVLARILIDKRMLQRPVGALALSCAAVDDVTAWGLLAIASGIAGQGSALHALPVLGYVFAFCVGMALLARPLLSRVSAAYDEAGKVPAGWIAAIFVGVLLSAYVSMKAGIAPIFGAFVMGLVMPRRADLSHDVTRRLEDFVSTVLLPLFFVVTGLKTDIGLLNRPVLWGITAAIVGVAILAKWSAASVIARVAGYGWRESSVLGALMNTRGLTELIVLNIGLELGVISKALFSMLVLMALVTTFMTAPAIRLLDPRRLLSAPVEEELLGAEGESVHDGAILVAPLAEENIDELLALAEPLARADPRREILLVRLLEPPRVTGPLATSDRLVADATRQLTRIREGLRGRGIHARTVAFTSANRGADLATLASNEKVHLIVMDGRRPLLGAGAIAGEVGAVLRDADCDVAVFVDQDRVPVIDAGHPVFVASGNTDNDRLAADLGRRIAGGTGAPLETNGMAPVGAGLLVVGLPEQWEHGLGRVRAGFAQAAAVPTLFVRSIRSE